MKLIGFDFKIIRLQWVFVVRKSYFEWLTCVACDKHARYSPKSSKYAYSDFYCDFMFLGNPKACPSVYLFAPPEGPQDDEMTLTCYVKHFYPKEVVVYWLANDEKLNNTEIYQQRTSSVIEVEKDSLYSVYSQLVFRREVWESGTVFSCFVYHEAIDPTTRIIARSIDNVSHKPTLVSLSMNVPSSCASF